MTLPEGWRASTLGKESTFQSVARQDSAPVLTFKGLHVDGSVVLGTAQDGRFARAVPGDTVVSRQGHVAGWAFKKVGLVHDAHGEVNVASTLQVIRPASGVLPVWMNRWLSTDATYQWVLAALGGRSSLTADVLSAVPVPVAPVKEQKRLAAFLEEQISGLDAAESALDQARLRLEGWVAARLRELLDGGGRAASFSDIYAVGTLPRKAAEVRAVGTDGRWPVVDQGAIEGQRRTDDETTVYQGPLPVVLFGDHTRRIKFLNSAFAVGGSGVKLLLAQEGVNPTFAYWVARGVAVRPRGYGRHFAMFRGAEFRLGDAQYQAWVVREMSEVSDLADRTRATLEAQRQRVTALRHDIFRAAFSGELSCSRRSGG